MADRAMGRRVPLSRSSLWKWGRWFLRLGIALLLTGCADFVDGDQTSVAPDAVFALEPSPTVSPSKYRKRGLAILQR
ncbi:MAG: hypothetical protein ACUVSJ_13590 [Anaerolineae bacterium]